MRLDDGIANINEIAGRLANFNVSVSLSGKFGNVQDNHECYFDKRITKVKQHHDDIFSDRYRYDNLTMKTPTGSVWWDWVTPTSRLNCSS